MFSSPSSRVPKSQVPTHASRCPRPLVPVPLLYTDQLSCFLLEAITRNLPCEQWFLQDGRYASMRKKPLRATVCFSIEHARPGNDYKYPTTRRQGELQQNSRFNKQNNNFARASRFYFYISLPFLHDYDVKMPNFAFYG